MLHNVANGLHNSPFCDFDGSKEKWSFSTTESQKDNMLYSECRNY